ncbi:Rieske 2Fe-2S domain-containing protein [Sinomonas mesophila]|uniref:Rieske 2Fe-2S domain-containing protein n=1 Tax=Sinomonas mesophila TaxID=1531955 RepID=UPI001FE8E045|nr:Rieske 2Fe-2S domain-containing protein [Sinomonas mesophila]
MADGTFISADEPLRSILTTRHSGTDYVLVGGEGHAVPAGGNSGDSGDRFTRLAAFSRERLGTCEPAYRWSTQDTLPADGLPLAGPLFPATAHHSPHLYAITGLRKWGLTNGTAAALVVADAITGADTPWARLFDSTREIAASRLPQGQRTTAAGPAPLPGGPPRPRPGHGTVVEIDGKAVALYSDHSGEVHALSARCTHLGCTVEFNGGESTWDCPCHGSRFALDGTVIQGPAETDLPARPLPGPFGKD